MVYVVGGKVIKILYEDNHILVVEKPINMLVQSDDTNDLDLLTLLKKYLKEKYDKKGNVYLGLIHRLDRPVSGVIVFAKTSKAASRLSEQVRNHEFSKVYYAIVEGKLDNNGEFTDKLLKDNKTNMVSISENGKLAKLEYTLIQYKDNKSLVKINLLTGRSHQIRVQFASRFHPLVGDQRYNKSAKVKEQIALFAKELTIIHPITKEKMTFSLDIPDRYPFNIFNKDSQN